MTIEELEAKYAKIPQEIKSIRRWVGYTKELRDGKYTKIPRNAINGGYSKSNDPNTWTFFKVAIAGCVKYGFEGLGFMLGEDANSGTCYFGIDLDNHPDDSGMMIPDDEFNSFANEFVEGLKSYSEYSQSGKGIHIICKGHLPEGARRKNGVAVEMYEKGRFFAMTGNAVNDLSINERTEEIKPLWEKYLKTKEDETRFYRPLTASAPTNMSDSELIDRIASSKNGSDFNALYNGDMSAYNDDHSAADMAFCKILAFWTGCDKAQMDRIFRSSALMREKWDKFRGSDTYGNITLDKAISTQADVYKPQEPERNVLRIANPNGVKPPVVKAETCGVIEPQSELVAFDERNDPIVQFKTIFKKYSLDDTGNAERFYDQFGQYFRYNKDNNKFMFWDGRTWKRDGKDVVRKYANKLIEALKAEAFSTKDELDEAERMGEEGSVNELKSLLKAQITNIQKISNKSGKDAMLSEFQSLHELPVVNAEFDTQDNLLNTQSGIVDLNTKEIIPCERKYMLSKNTNCKIDKGEPVVWKKFLHDIFERPNQAETEELIDTIQMALGESLTGRTNKEHLFILYGNGSNGKSTFIKVVNDAFGDYGTSMSSDLLISNPNANNQSNEFSLSALLGARMVSTSETAEGKRLDEVMIKRMLSGEKITAQFKYGQPFSFMPTFSPWMSTNNRPIIRATDFGTWRRIFYVPFLNTFTAKKKDVDMPKKLAAELPKILWWMIEGAYKLHTEYNDKLPKPQCLESALSEYKKELDVVVAYINARCIPFKGIETEASKIYQNYKEWARDNSEHLHSESRFKQEMQKKGYSMRKDPNRGWMYIGIKLSTDNRGIVFGKDNQ